MFLCAYAMMHVLQAGQIEFGLRLQVNSYRYLKDPSTAKKGGSTGFSPGLNIQMKTSPTSFLRAAVLYQRRNYQLNYHSGNASFTNADLRLTESELSFGQYLFSQGRDQGFYLNGGLQMLNRNWGEEIYQEAIIANTYWPQTRVSTLLGAGYSVLTNSGMKIHLGVSMNHFIGDKMAFETNRHQYSFYIQFNGINKFKSVDPIHRKCNNQF